MKHVCPNCKTNKGIVDPYYGLLPCEDCQKRASGLKSPQPKTLEFTSDHIKQERKEYANDIEQPHRNGELNKKWVDLYGEKKALQHGFTKEEIKKAKYVWSGTTSYYKE